MNAQERRDRQMALTLEMCPWFSIRVTEEDLEAYIGYAYSPDGLTVSIPLINMREASLPRLLIDTSDLPLIRTISCQGVRKSARKVRVMTKVNGQSTQLARLLLGITDPNIHAHHINGEPLDNRRSNLHVCTATEHRRIHRKNFLVLPIAHEVSANV